MLWNDCASMMITHHTAPQQMFFSFSTSLQFDIQSSSLLHRIPCLHYASLIQNQEPTIAQQCFACLYNT